MRLSIFWRCPIARAARQSSNRPVGSRAASDRAASRSATAGDAAPTTKTRAVKRTAKPAPDRSAESRRFAIETARLVADTRCHQVAVLDVRGLSPVTDYLVLGNGTSPRQMRSAAEEVGEFATQRGFAPLSTGGMDSESWIVLDCVDVVLHLFSQDARSYYDLDGLWGDAPRIDWETESKAPAPAKPARKPRTRSSPADDAAPASKAPATRSGARKRTKKPPADAADAS